MSQISPLPLDLTDRIPQEIFEEVTAYADEEGDLESLLNLSLVSQWWEAFTRPLLFTNVKFNAISVGWLIGNPHSWQRVLPWVQRARFTSVGNILGMEGELADIFRRMPLLSDLQVQNGGQSLVVLLGKAFKGSHQITNLELNVVSGFPSFPVLLEVIISFPALQTLTLSEVGWETRSFSENARAELAAWSAVPSKLREVTIEWMERDTDTSLVLSCLSHGCADAIRFIEAEGSVVLSKFTRVETLIITGPRFTIRPPNLETLSGFKALKTLVIWPAIWLLPGGHIAIQNQTWYSQLLSSVASPLSSLTFSLAYTAEEQLEHMDWETINNLFQNSPFYAELKEVGVNLSLSHQVGPTVNRADCDRMIRRRIVGLRPGTRLTVKVYGGQDMISSFMYE